MLRNQTLLRRFSFGSCQECINNVSSYFRVGQIEPTEEKGNKLKTMVQGQYKYDSAILTEGISCAYAARGMDLISEVSATKDAVCLAGSVKLVKNALVKIWKTTDCSNSLQTLGFLGGQNLRTFARKGSTKMH